MPANESIAKINYQALDNIIDQEKLDKYEAYKFVDAASYNPRILNGGTRILRVIPNISKLSRFSPLGERHELYIRVLTKISSCMQLA